jgi:hypothetical protein
MTDPIRFPRILIISCVLLVGVALVLAAGVVPSVKTDHFRGATPERAVPVFWFMIVVNLLATWLLARTAILKVHAGRSWRVLTGLTAIVVLLFAVGLTDGAFAYSGHGPDMLLTSVRMFFCAACEIIAGALALTAAFLRPGGPKAA